MGEQMARKVKGAFLFQVFSTESESRSVVSDSL